MQTKVVDVYFILAGEKNFKYYLHHYKKEDGSGFYLKGNYPGDGNNDINATILMDIEGALKLIDMGGSIRVTDRAGKPSLIGHMKKTPYYRLHIHNKYKHFIKKLVDVGSTKE